MDFVKGRGRKAHMRQTQDLTACGRTWDKLLDKQFVDASEFCGNCKRTYDYQAAMGLLEKK